MTITEKQFAAVCFLILMNHHGDGIEEAHPSYIEEKLPMLNSGYEAYGYLDHHNRMAVLIYLKKWHYDLPEQIKLYEQDYGYHEAS